MFSGSYNSDDVEFLLKPIEIPYTSVEEKEQRLQSGIHYSEMLSYEGKPSQEYEKFFQQSIQRNGGLLAYHVQQMAKMVLQSKPKPVIVSIARAGTPIGVLLKQAIKLENFNAKHFSISLLRGRGVDTNALTYIAANFDSKDVIFVDGWCGKGGIYRELIRSVKTFNATHGTQFSTNMYVVSDPLGITDTYVTREDYLIPNAVLNSTVSGLVSRTILNREYVGPNDYHGCVVFDELKDVDRSMSFVKDISRNFIDHAQVEHPTSTTPNVSFNSVFNRLPTEFSTRSPHLIKPGVGEATRSLLRRQTELMFVENMDDDHIQHLIFLAKSKNVPIRILETSPYKVICVVTKN